MTKDQWMTEDQREITALRARVAELDGRAEKAIAAMDKALASEQEMAQIALNAFIELSKETARATAAEAELARRGQGEVSKFRAQVTSVMDDAEYLIAIGFNGALVRPDECRKWFDKANVLRAALVSPGDGWHKIEKIPAPQRSYLVYVNDNGVPRYDVAFLEGTRPGSDKLWWIVGDISFPHESIEAWKELTPPASEGGA